jgi:hypothetical protein
MLSGKMREEKAMPEIEAARICRAGVGYCLVAPGVYLWDEDRREIERAARELRSGLRPRPTQRMLVIPAQDVAPALR